VFAVTKEATVRGSRLATSFAIAMQRLHQDVQMSVPSPTDWSFAEVSAVDALRSARLESAPAFEIIVSQLRAALADALAHKHFRCGIDSYRGHQRAIFQFWVPSELYDYFFNSRAGYRAQYWIAPEHGQTANAERLCAAWQAMLSTLPDDFEARKIETTNDWDGRKDVDVGSRQVLRSFFEASFNHAAAKIWICERLILGHAGPLQAIPIHDGPRLLVQRWPTARAPCPWAESTWLDLKGGFVSGEQPKDPWIRAKDINKLGYS
jgi:hypothetical protein